MLLPVTSLQLVEQVSWPLVHLFLKREDQLPYGGGSKIRRLFHWRDTHPKINRVSVLSDVGSHTFYSLAQMAELFETLTFYERNRLTSPYREKLRAIYCQPSNVRIVQGQTGWLWLQSLGERDGLLGMGGKILSASIAYEQAMRECVEQLHDQGFVDSLPVWHLFPIASGTMADGFISFLSRQSLKRHHLWGVLTGHPLFQLGLRMKYRTNPWMTLLRKRTLSWEEQEPLCQACLLQTGLHLDRNHGVFAWQELLQTISAIKQETIVVFWVTAPQHPILNQAD